jgi:DNA-binding beta-propeller fold protein YncE
MRMPTARLVSTSAAAAAAGAFALMLVVASAATGVAQQAAAVPSFEVAPDWPQVPNGWVLGEVTSIAVAPDDHVWVLHRPRSIPEAQRAQAAPPVLEFDADGRLLRSWGGPSDAYDWPEREHGIQVASDGHVWITGNGGWPKPSPDGSTDDMILEFTEDGTLVKQIGRRGASSGNADRVNVHQPGDAFVYTKTGELFVADGYGNNRVIVFDAATGAFKRMWGAFGNTPETPAARGRGAAPAGPDGPPQFGLVHAVKVSDDGIVYVADRSNNRIQTFTVEGQYLRQVSVATAEGDPAGVPAGFAFSPDPDQRLLYVVDSGPMRIVVFDRRSLTQLGAIGMRGAGPGEFDIVHHMAADSKGNLYAAEIVTNRRAQKLVLQPAR